MKLKKKSFNKLILAINKMTVSLIIFSKSVIEMIRPDMPFDLHYNRNAQHNFIKQYHFEKIELQIQKK